MTPQKVIDNLNCQIKQIDDLLKNMSDSEKRRFKSRLLKEQETLQECKKIFEKQISKELSYEGDGYDDNGEMIYDTAFCPNCEKEFEVYYCEHGNYCPNCGQALDWSDKE